MRPLPVNQLDLAAGDMINAQRDALNAALRDAQEQVRNVLYENTFSIDNCADRSSVSKMCYDHFGVI